MKPLAEQPDIPHRGNGKQLLPETIDVDFALNW
jgi:hypothetical protein